GMTVPSPSFPPSNWKRTKIASAGAARAGRAPNKACRIGWGAARVAAPIAPPWRSRLRLTRIVRIPSVPLSVDVELGEREDERDHPGDLRLEVGLVGEIQGAGVVVHVVDERLAGSRRDVLGDPEPGEEAVDDTSHGAVLVEELLQDELEDAR